MSREKEDAHALGEALPGCTTCAQVIELFNTTVSDTIRIPLGIVRSLVDTDCPHGEWIKNFRNDVHRIKQFYDGKMDATKGNWGSMIHLSLSRGSGSSLGGSVELVNRKNGRKYPGGGRILDPSWIDKEVILDWKERCNRAHGDACEHPEKFRRINSAQPTWLVDTLDGCLVPGNEERTRYVTLSYTWGQTETLRNDKSIVDQLQNPGVLAEGSLAEKVPRTVRDAINIVPLLGERYLWVDSLCIVQDDAETLRAELNRMARIYATSYLTILATGGIDANYGLRGFRGVTSPRVLKQKVIPLAPPERLIVPIRRAARHMQTSNYYSRAWTYQENIFAKRRLIFENETVYWQCNNSDWSEELIPDLAWSREPTKYSELFMVSRIPDLKNIIFLMESYNRKILTFPDDALSAFSGIQSVLDRTFEGGLLYAIPELFFEAALMWNPIGTLKRRHSTRRSNWKSQLPSWSWLGWHGQVSFSEESVYRKGVCRPVTTWYTVEYPTSSKKRPIASNWYKYKCFAQDKTQTLLPGWERTELKSQSDSERAKSNPTSGPKYHYFHSSSPNDFFGYPVPVLESTREQNPREQTQFLWCQTSRAFVHGVPRSTKGPGFPDSWMLNKARLHDPEGDTIGYLHLMQDEDRELFTTRPTPGTLVELVALSEGFFEHDHDSDDEHDEDSEDGEVDEPQDRTGITPISTEDQVKDNNETGEKSSERYKLLSKRARYINAKATRAGSGKRAITDKDRKNAKTQDKDFDDPYYIVYQEEQPSRKESRRDCYHVLWIEWEDGVAYRRANGCVLKDSWERLKEKELVDLILG